jgi:hypothetical protein
MTPPPRRRWLLSPNHLIWLLPLLVGAAAWRHANQAALSGAGSSDLGQGRETPDRPDAYRGDPSALFEATLREHLLPPASEEAPSQAALTGEARRARLLSLFSRAEDYPMTSTNETREMDELARDLGRQEGAAGLAWMDANLPAVRRFTMDGWADADPAAAFASLVRGDRINAGFHSTVMKLLAGKAAAGGSDALRAAVAQVPWPSFPRDDFSYPGYDESLVFPLQGSAQAWIDSGVAQSMAEQGVQIRGLYKQWAEQDLTAALQAWTTWPPAKGSRDAGQFQEIFDATARNPQGRQQLTDALESAGPELRQRLTPLIARYRQDGDEQSAAYFENLLAPAQP